MTSYDDWGNPTGKPARRPQDFAGTAAESAKLLLQRTGVYTPSGGPGHRWNFRRIFSVPNVLIALWVFYLYYGERSVFRHRINDCQWDNWESWPEDATPHRLAFVADPQLVDPHTYPGRPWPLSTLTVDYTDQYLRRTYSSLQTSLHPDTVMFLGDLFDGGREWTADGSKSPEEQWRAYGDNFWLREYDRFGRIFFKHWGDGGMLPGVGQLGRKIIAGLPGNHDLGFAAGVRMNVRKRFQAYFGDGSRIDVIGNHTIVSVDTVSLSALGHTAGDEQIWKPVQEFLDGAQAEKKRVVTRELRSQRGLPPNPRYKHGVVDTGDLAKAALPAIESSEAEFPTILLTHVPLYRAEGTPCGPLREHWPPSPPPKGQEEPVNPDERNAIAVRGGYQYQNVLTQDVSKDITEKIGNIAYAFSGDDHDYCEVVHRGYPSAGGGIREITVKSMSWAMGVRKPGFLMLSMWNPVNEHGKTVSEKQDAGKPTIQSHLCLLPDQLGIFIRYGILLGLSLLTLIVRAAVLALKASPPPTDEPILPLSQNFPTSENGKTSPNYNDRRGDSDGSSSNSSTTSDKGGLSARSSKPRYHRNGSPGGGYGLPAPQQQKQQQQQPRYSLALVQHAGYFVPASGADEKKAFASTTTMSKTKKQKGQSLFLRELVDGLVRVASVVLLWYFWLVWRW